MRLHHLLLSAALAVATAVSPSALGDVGDSVENTEQIENFQKTGAETFADFQGRAVLVEFFAFW